jgi:CRISPR-associated protein Cas2
MRTLYLTAYDVADPRRLRRVYRYLNAYRVGGQKSVPEIWVTPAELQWIRADISDLLNPGEDRLHIFALDPRMKTICAGRGKTFTADFFSIV